MPHTATKNWIYHKCKNFNASVSMHGSHAKVWRILSTVVFLTMRTSQKARGSKQQKYGCTYKCWDH